MKIKKHAYDPFNPENIAVLCPDCGKDKLRPREPNVRGCRTCGRVEQFEKPHREIHGDRRYQRLMAWQKKKFGAIEGMVLPQWVVRLKGHVEQV